MPPSLLTQLFNHFFPGSCLLCGEHAGGALLCPACAAELPRLPASVCLQCAQPTAQGGSCGDCQRHPPHFDSTLGLFRYEFPVDRIIQALKYGHQLAVARWLGQSLARHPDLPACDLLMPMPLHPQRLRQRGFNQAAEMARWIARAHVCPLDTHSLFRVRATSPQAKLNISERHSNVRGAFACRTDLSGRSVLLIDDVMTSGATANECARLLKLHGATHVSVAVAGRAL